MEKLHPAAQVALIVMMGIFFTSFYLAAFTDFWNNISNRKKK